MTYTLGQAAKTIGKSKNTLARAIHSGKLSATRQEDGSYTIDPAELHRVYPPTHSELSHGTPIEPSPDTATLHPSHQIQIDILERERQTLLGVVDDLRTRLDAAESERRQAQERLTALLTHQPALPQITPTPAVRPIFWVILAIAVIGLVAWHMLNDQL